MKTHCHFYLVLLCYTCSFTTSLAQNAVVSFKIKQEASGCFGVYFKSSQTIDSSGRYKGKITIAATPETAQHLTNILERQGLNFNIVNDKKYQYFPSEAKNLPEYIHFSFDNLYLPPVAADTDYFLFTFCLSGGCRGKLQLLNGLSSNNPAKNTFTGIADRVLDDTLYNSFTLIDKNAELYQGDNEEEITACPPDLVVYLTPIVTDITTTDYYKPYNFRITANNIGGGSTTGPITTVIQLPIGISYINGGGNGWTCTPADTSANDITTVTCINNTIILPPESGKSSFEITVKRVIATNASSSVNIQIENEIYTQNNGATSHGIFNLDDEFQPIGSYKIQKEPNGCYNIYAKISEMVDYATYRGVVNIVAPVGTHKNIVNLIVPEYASLTNTNQGRFEAYSHPTDASLEYIVFSMDGYFRYLPANTDKFLFSFCLSTNCTGSLRLLNGIDPESLHPYNGMYDLIWQNTAIYNYISLSGRYFFYNDMYRGDNYGGPANCSSAANGCGIFAGTLK